MNNTAFNLIYVPIISKYLQWQSDYWYYSTVLSGSYFFSYAPNWQLMSYSRSRAQRPNTPESVLYSVRVKIVERFIWSVLLQSDFIAKSAESAQRKLYFKNYIYTNSKSEHNKSFILVLNIKNALNALWNIMLCYTTFCSFRRYCSLLNNNIKINFWMYCRWPCRLQRKSAQQNGIPFDKFH